MSVKSTVLLTLGLLVTMLGAGAASGWYSYRIGAEALEGVSQPDMNPTRKITGNKSDNGNPQEFTPVDEKKIIVDTVAYIQENKKRTEVEKSPSLANPDREKEEKKNSFLKEEDNTSENSTEANFPLTVQDQGVTFAVVKGESHSGSYVLDVTLKNDGTKAVEFLYSFLEVKDNQGNTLSAITEGLPDILPANGETFKGTVKLPSASVAEGAQISLSLTDYPEQKLQLSLAQIPVAR